MSSESVGDYEKTAEADYESLSAYTDPWKQSVFSAQTTGKCVHCGKPYTFGNYLMSDGKDKGAYHAKCARGGSDAWWLK